MQRHVLLHAGATDLSLLFQPAREGVISRAKHIARRICIP